MPSLREFKFTVWGSETITAELLEKCAKLFSANYGHWGANGLRPGQAVLLSPDRLRSQYLFNSETCSLITAEKKSSIGFELVAQAFVCTFPFRQGYAVWVTQLVVRKDMRQMGLATELLSKAWTKNAVAWGLITSHPHAVKALERAAQRKCIPKKIGVCAQELIRASQIPYFQKFNETTINDGKCVIHSRFYVDHREVNEYVSQMEAEWKLGPLDEGDEFFAFTFKD